VRFLLVRQAVVSDWKFFLDDDDWLNLWARRYRDAGAQALADELRHLPWRAPRDQSTASNEMPSRDRSPASRSNPRSNP